MRNDARRSLCLAILLFGTAPAVAQFAPPPGTYTPAVRHGVAVTQPSYAPFPTTGLPSRGFTPPLVPLVRPTDTSAANSNNSVTSQPTAAAVSDNSGRQSSPVPPVPSSPENPNAMATGHVMSVQEPSAGSRSSSNAKSPTPTVRYFPGQEIVGTAIAYDGHSLAVEGHAIRLDGVDAPGLLQTCTIKGVPWRCGEKAYRRLASLVKGRKVVCRVTEQVGSGAAAVCSSREVKDLAEVMVREGLAVPNGHDRGRYSGPVAGAKQSRAGMWVGEFESPKIWRSANVR